jgi:transcriptional regulator with XRE-family HTH domain
MMTQQELAGEYITRNMLSRIENGFALPSIPTLLYLAEKLGVPAGYLLADETEEKERLHLAAVSSGGMIGKAKKLLFDATFLDMTGLCFRILSNMQKSSDVAEYSACVMKYKANLTPFLDVMEICARDALMFKTGHKNLVMNKSRLADVAKAGFTFLPASLIGVIERCSEAKQALKTNANAQMVADTLLFGILEGKYQWRKS